MGAPRSRRPAARLWSSPRSTRRTPRPSPTASPPRSFFCAAARAGCRSPAASGMPMPRAASGMPMPAGRPSGMPMPQGGASGMPVPQGGQGGVPQGGFPGGQGDRGGTAGTVTAVDDQRRRHGRRHHLRGRAPRERDDEARTGFAPHRGRGPGQRRHPRSRPRRSRAAGARPPSRSSANGKTETRTVTAGQQSGAQTEVVSGLNEGENVVYTQAFQGSRRRRQSGMPMPQGGQSGMPRSRATSPAGASSEGPRMNAGGQARGAERRRAGMKKRKRWVIVGIFVHRGRRRGGGRRRVVRPRQVGEPSTT